MSVKFRAALSSVAAAVALMAAGSAHAVTVNATTNQIESSGLGDVFVRYDSLSAGDSSDLVAVDFGGGALFNNQSATPGSLYNIGSYALGETLEFQLNNLTKSLSFFTGLASDNPDNVLHAQLSVNPDGSIRVAFEDLPNGGDFDYNDLVFTVYETPLPGAAALLLSGLAGLGFAGRGKSKKPAQ